MRNIEIKPAPLSTRAEESFKLLRSNLQFSGADKKVILFTSCMQNEGKSSVTMNLAISLAEAGKKVLLLDADLRKSVLLGRMKIAEKVEGLTHYLSKQAPLTDVICATNIRGLHMMFAGPQPPNPAELLGSEMFAEMITVLRKVYDYVLVDAPPLGYVIDAAVAARACDASVLVIESGVISYRFAQDVKKQLEKTGCPFLGVVLNKVDMNYGSYGNYGRYGSYGSYGKYGERGNSTRTKKKQAER